MSRATSRLRNLTQHFLPTSSWPTDPKGDFSHPFNRHTLSPTFFLPRAAAIEPDAQAIYHVTINNKVLRRSYIETADRARGFAYYLKRHGFKRVGILCPNTPAFLESIFAIAAAGAVNVDQAVNYRLKPEDIAYIFNHSEVDAIVVDEELVPLLNEFKKQNGHVPLIIDTDTDAVEGELSGPFDQAVLEGLHFDTSSGNRGWQGLEAQTPDEDALIALAYTSGTTSRPKGVEYIHRGCYLAALANGRCRYLWTLPMFHAMGWTFPWAVTAVRGTHYCLRKVDYSLIWRLLKEEGITHYCAAPTVNTVLCNSKEAETDVPEGTIIDVEKNGEEIGEVVFVGNICAKGYYKNVEDTKKLFSGGVLHSGDLAVWHPDGAIQILDRAKDIIISGGENISSVALESMLATHPDIFEVGVVAVPDSHWGERPKAFITVRDDKKLDGKDVIEWAKHHWEGEEECAKAVGEKHGSES
ncbi:conserved hypothetical protein [Histoplasma mississippiense (nom. inval.)]|uniref:conserved hypothetical protein n=1 Tax=Ajellomyces capsulatus (strain NAm1 / WU24) TaxID=2059318 RepID=UPI000157B2C4|nr:conserved hypothetical protein [Histoplasma mississippiense (nom. inval.)]EDN02301.1 conserved hypothetical protein [Histoplasma mississippiense (nom. inval.)]